MAAKVVDETGVLEEAIRLVRSASVSVDLASPWIRGTVLRRILMARPAEVRTRILFRAKEPEDLEITDLGALLSAAAEGAEVRYSERLHAKIICVDGERAMVSSSNLTEAAGFGPAYTAHRRNRELGLVVEDDPATVADVLAGFEDAWTEGEWLDEDVVGVAMDFPTDREFHIACWRPPAPGAYVSARDAEGRPVVGRVRGLTGYNRTFPRMTAGMWATQGYGAAPDAGGRSYEYEDLQSLFSTPDKERGVLGVVAAHDPDALFQVARVECLATLSDGSPLPPLGPPAPGGLVRRAGADVLEPLLGGGTVELGVVWHHDEVPVRAKAEELLTRHLAVLGMTGSGKSNALLVLIDELVRLVPDLRVLLVDTHGEYGAAAKSLGGRRIVADLRTDLLADGELKQVLGLSREDATLLAKVREAAESGGEGGFVEALETVASSGDGAWTSQVPRLASLVRESPGLFCVGGRAVCFDLPWGPGVNVVDVGGVTTLEGRAKVVAAALDEVFASATQGGGPWLAVVDEAQNYAPEQQTGLLARVRPSFEAAFRIASEGRKFGVGLVVASQRPARVNKDILSQCNSHMVFRVANVEDLHAVAGCFETAGKRLLDDLPGLPVGVCLAGGTAFGMPVRVEMGLFDLVRGGRRGPLVAPGRPETALAPGEVLD